MENINQPIFIYSKSLSNLNIPLKKLNKNLFVTNVQSNNFNKLIPYVLNAFYHNKLILRFNKTELLFNEYDFLLSIFKKSNPYVDIKNLLQLDKILKLANKNLYLIYDNNNHKINFLDNIKENKLDILNIKELFNIINSLIYIKYNLINKNNYNIIYISGINIKHLSKKYTNRYFPHFYFNNYDKSLHIVSELKHEYLKTDTIICKDNFDNIIIPKINKSIENLSNYFKKYVI